jgi:hypothetical protein
MTVPAKTTPPGSDAFWAWFDEHICNRTTATFLRTPEADFLLEQYRDRVRDEIAAIRSAIARDARPADGRGLRVALSNWSLQNRSGSELWTFDIAGYLQRHDTDVIVHAPVLGAVADAITASAIRVTSSADEVLAFAPDIVHLNHAEAVKDVVAPLMSGQAKVVNMCHGLYPRPGLPLRRDAHRYCATSITAKTKIRLLTGGGWDTIHIIPNFFDAARFRRRDKRESGKKALVYSNKVGPDDIALLRAAIERHGYQFDAAGQWERPVDRPEEILPGYDLVFAVGRSAIEALGCGCQVVIWEYGVIGPLVTPENFWTCVVANFALTSQLLPYRFTQDADSQIWLEREMSRASPQNEETVSDLTRDCLSLDVIGPLLTYLYRDVSGQSSG